MSTRPTIAHMTVAQQRRYGDRILYYYYQDGKWLSASWRDGDERCQWIAGGLWKLGCRHGDKVAIISETRPEWSLIDLAVLNFGGVVVGIYAANTAEQVRYILEHSESRVVFVEDEQQLAKVQQFRAQLPQLEQVVGIDVEPTDGNEWLGLKQLEQLSNEVLEQPGWLDERLESVQPSDVATLVYTSGTTGPPKGVVLTHENLYEIADVAGRVMGLKESDVSVAFLPLAHSLQRVSSYAGMRAGVTGYYCPSLDRLPETWQEAHPTVLSSVPRIFEKVHTKIFNGLAEQPARRQKMFHGAMAVGRRYTDLIRRGRPVPWYLRLAYQACDRVIFSRVRAKIFGGRVRYLISGGAPISVELLEFFHAMGLLILEGYGLTETSAPATLNRPEAFRFGTVGQALPKTELKIAEDGEILIRGIGVFNEYYKEPEATAAAIDAEGWFRSGDIGQLDADGYLRITDRKKDLIITAGGKNVAPQNIENLLKTDPHISQVMVHGDKRKYLVALITLDDEEMAHWARENGREGLDMAALAKDEAVQTMVQQLVDSTNEQLARFETIKKFRILPEDLSVENGMLTPTLKVKRRNVEGTYSVLLEEMYDEAAKV